MASRAFLRATLASTLLGCVADQAAELTSHQTLGREIYRELIETDTTHPTGDTTAAAEMLARRFRRAGFPEADIHVVGPTPRNKNLVVRDRGTSAHTPVVLLAHLDVVEAPADGPDVRSWMVSAPSTCP